MRIDREDSSLDETITVADTPKDLLADEASLWVLASDEEGTSSSGIVVALDR